MSTSQRIALLLVAAGISFSLQAQPSGKLPPIIQQEIAQMMKECRDVGGKPARSPGLLTVADFTGDGLPDYLIHQGGFVCDGAASLFSGNQGSSMAVYVSTADGQVSKAFDEFPQNVQIDKTVSPARILLTVEGAPCGQRVTSNTPRSELRGCVRPVEWNEKTRKMQLAPMSRTRPVQ